MHREWHSISLSTGSSKEDNNLGYCPDFRK